MEQHQLSDRHASLYLLSRLAAAILNLVSVAVFTRLAPPEVFGSYLVGFATAFVVFGTLFQWLLHAHFGVYEPDRAAPLAGALVVLLGLGLGAGSCVFVLIVLLGRLDAETAVGMGLLIGCFVIHIGAIEIGRAHLLVRDVTAASLLRGILMLGMGSAALLLWPSAGLLLAAIGVAQALAILPILRALRRTIWAMGWVAPTRGDVVALLRYGWPLIAALAAAALALNLDRIVLDQQFGAVMVAAYGATADVIRQGFVVLGEAIAAAYVSQAKAKAAYPLARRAALERAFVTLWTVVLFGAVCWLLFGRVVLSALLAPGYAEAASGAVHLLVLGTVMMVLRAYYFGQVIYFAGSARRDMQASLVTVGVAALGCLLLIPSFGASGAAFAYALSQASGLTLLLWADRQTRIMPIALRPMLEATIWAITTAVAAAVLVALGWFGWCAAVVLVLSSALTLALRWNLFDSRTLLSYARASRRQ